MDKISEFARRYQLSTECLCGVTVALAQIPEAVAFALVAGLSPAIGVNSAWIIGVLTAIFGGRPAMICGATGALAVIIPDLIIDHGKEYLFWAVILMGCIQMVFGILQVSRLIKMIPVPVMMGFCNGLALVIGLAQFKSYKVIDNSRALQGRHSEQQYGRRLAGAFGPFTDGKEWIHGDELVWSIVITFIAFFVSVLLPKLTKKIPSALTAILLCTVFEWLILRPAVGCKTALVADASDGGIGGDLPGIVWFSRDYKMPPLNVDTLQKIWSVSLILASVGILESLMTLNLIDDITQTHGNPTRECLAQGFANMVCGAFGGMGGCAMIGQSMINVGSGARHRVSSISAGVFLLMIVLVAYPMINIIPISALTGVMFNVVYSTFEWNSLKLLAAACMPMSIRSKFDSLSSQKIRRVDAFVIFLVTMVTLFTDLALAVCCGTVVSCLMFAWDCSELITATTSADADGAKVYDINGILFFGSTKKFTSLFDADSDPEKICISFQSGLISDYSAVDCLNQIADRYAKHGKSVVLQKLRPASHKVLTKAAGLVSKGIELEIEKEELIPKDQSLGLNVKGFNQQLQQNTQDETAESTITRRRRGKEMTNVVGAQADI
eukprot:gnl/MRDRNA2_/MRDRNA2_154122_c0_seq1.p1 gnl/MRDRNA2_/MRDRNA2_154122_c0~~gnl/MRDRNA2_/MRDRNA2_154122_c0_seq1.p1  ORF type:complete len:610 (+),score=81.99 gnl/MRDRNA2_/MRDRNA2_154122_c0_seq1:94-1923(+)